MRKVFQEDYSMALREWYPARKVFAEHKLQVSDIHTLHIEECGNPDGQPVLWCHGGPGSGIAPVHGRQFDPDHYRIILFDQRGSGKSVPFTDIRENTTQDLMSDMEKIREKLGIERWIVSGRSWGTTLAVAYAQAYPDRVKGLFLAAMFLCDKAANHWLFQEGASRVFPKAWSEFESLVPKEKRGAMMDAYREMMFGDDEKLGVEAARRWGLWEAATVFVVPPDETTQSYFDPTTTLALGRLECHYLRQGGFLEEGQLLRDAGKIAHIPTKIVHGQFDMNCLLENAWRMHKALPNSELIVVPQGGHATNDPVTIDRQVRAADALKGIE